MAARPSQRPLPIAIFLTADHAAWAAGCYGNRDHRPATAAEKRVRKPPFWTLSGNLPALADGQFTPRAYLPAMVTIYEVAKLASVSPKTAARILAGSSGRVYNRERVLQAAKKLGYIRNQQAANLRSGRSGLLGVIVPDISNPFYPVFFQTIHDIALGLGYQILLSSTFGKTGEEIHALRMFEVNRVEGIILNASEGEGDEECDDIVRRFTQRGIPVVLAGRPARGLPVDEIVLKNVQAVERAGHYLVKTGHKRIGFISGPLNNLGMRERHTGYERALRAAGLAPDPNLATVGLLTAESGREQARRILSASGRPTAILAANDLLALGAMKACLELGLKVPRDVAIIGFDDILLAQLVTPALTTLRQPQEQIARDSLNLLISRIAGKDRSKPRKLVYDAELIIRESA
jgi:DNA-binding LacI/PurR family transcriptional regulator